MSTGRKAGRVVTPSSHSYGDRMRPIVLESSSKILAEVKRLFSKGRRRRVVLVGYVGQGAETLLPRIRGTEIYCWDQPGGTNPTAIRALIRAGARVHFAPRLHMKVYWAEGVGALVGSANLSANGLQAGGLHEVAVLLPPDAIQIDSLIRTVRARAVTPKMLAALEQRTIEYRSRNPAEGRSTKRQRLPSFGEWVKDGYRAPWALFPYFDDSLELIPESTRELERRGFDDAPDYWTGDAGKTLPLRWVLSVDLVRGRNGIYWSCADFRVAIPPSSPEYQEQTPYFAVQLHEAAVYGEPPFNAREVPFKKAVNAFLKANGISTSSMADRFPSNGVLSPDLLRQLKQHYRDAGGKI